MWKRRARPNWRRLNTLTSSACIIFEMNGFSSSTGRVMWRWSSALYHPFAAMSIHRDRSTLRSTVWSGSILISPATVRYSMPLYTPSLYTPGGRLIRDLPSL